MEYGNLYAQNSHFTIIIYFKILPNANIRKQLNYYRRNHGGQNIEN